MILGSGSKLSDSNVPRTQSQIHRRVQFQYKQTREAPVQVQSGIFTNQIQVHPCLPQNELKKYCEGKGILLVAYSAIGTKVYP